MIGDGIVLTEEVAGYPAGTKAVITALHPELDQVDATIDGTDQAILGLLTSHFRMETFADVLEDGKK